MNMKQMVTQMVGILLVSIALSEERAIPRPIEIEYRFVEINEDEMKELGFTEEELEKIKYRNKQAPSPSSSAPPSRIDEEIFPVVTKENMAELGE